MSETPEVWLRGALPDIPPTLQPVAHSLLQSREELRAVLNRLSPDDLWVTPSGAASIGFHARHAAGSLDRLFTYARGEALNDTQKAALRFESSVERRLLEVAIITVGARWRAEFEWWAHSRMALQHGVGAETVDAIARRETPTAMPDDERIVHAIACQLVDDGHVDEATYAAARGLLGDRGIVELVTLCGYYTLVCFTLNAFEVALPPGATPVWEGNPT